MQNRLKYWRERRGLSMAGLAERASTTAPTVNKIEKGYMQLTSVWIERLARALDITPAELIGVDHPPGLRENAEPYLPEPGHFLSGSNNWMFVTMRTSDLDEHPLGISSGSVLVVDLSVVNWEEVPAGEIVVISMFDKTELTRTQGLLVAQFLPPNKLVSNTKTDNWIVSLDDPELSFEPVLRGIVKSVLRGGR